VQASWTAGRLNKVHTVAQAAAIGAAEAMTDHSYRNVRQAAKWVGFGHCCAEFWTYPRYNSRGADDNSTVAIPVMKVKFFGVGAPTFHIALRRWDGSSASIAGDLLLDRLGS
jgi:hypothetical protein